MKTNKESGRFSSWLLAAAMLFSPGAVAKADQAAEGKSSTAPSVEAQPPLSDWEIEVLEDLELLENLELLEGLDLADYLALFGKED